MKHLLKIGSLVVVLMCILVSNSFAGSKKILSPAIYGETYVICMIRNIDDKKQIDGNITICKLDSAECLPTTPFSLNPGEVMIGGWADGNQYYYCNFEVSRKKVSASICSDIGCMAVPRK
jgi:hypothetical protein